VPPEPVPTTVSRPLVGPVLAGAKLSRSGQLSPGARRAAQPERSTAKPLGALAAETTPAPVPALVTVTTRADESPTSTWPKSIASGLAWSLKHGRLRTQSRPSGAGEVSARAGAVPTPMATTLRVSAARATTPARRRNA